MNPDIIGAAILDFQLNNNPENIITYSTIAGNDEIETSFLFRMFKEMPLLEQLALNSCVGTVLDVGCGAGSHSLYLQNQGFKVQAIDISTGAIKTCILRGVKTAKLKNIWEVKDQKFDTIIALMNGIGICGRLEKLTSFLIHLKSLLKPDGQIMLDSSDLIYMYKEDVRERLLNNSEKYYGEVIYEMVYKNEFSDLTPWLFVDFKTLELYANKAGLNCTLLKKGPNFDFLVRLTIGDS